MGHFFFRDGQARFDPSIIFADKGIYGFANLNRFFEPSYLEFYKLSNFHLYEITVDTTLSEKNDQVVFLEDKILSKTEIEKTLI